MGIGTDFLIRRRIVAGMIVYQKRFRAIILLLFLLGATVVPLWLTPVDSPDPSSAQFRSASSGQEKLLQANKPVKEYIDVIKQGGKLRILVQGSSKRFPQRRNAQPRLILQYAKEQGLTPVWITRDQRNLSGRYLLNGTADVVVTTKRSLDPELRDQLSVTQPWGNSREQLVVRRKGNRITRIEDLATRQVALKRSSPVWPRLQKVSRHNLGMDIIAIPENMDDEAILQNVASGRYDVAAMDSLTLETSLPRYPDLKVALNLGRDRLMVWAVRADSVKLYRSLKLFLNKKHLELAIARFYREDLPQLKQRKLLRLITYQSPVNYFFDKGKLKGFEYELLKRFARNNKMRLDVVIASSHKEMQNLLLQGKGDLIAASLPADNYGKTGKVDYTQPYNYAAPVIIGRKYDYPLLDIRDLGGRHIVLSAESPYRKELERVKARGIDVEVVNAVQGKTTEETLSLVADGIYDLTVIGSHQLNAELIRHLNLKAHFTLTDPSPHVWVVRHGDTRLLSALNDFINKEFRRGFYNVLYAKYIENPLLYKNNAPLLASTENLSPYDVIVHKYAEQYGFDWRLIVAQMYQESQFDPEAVSRAGAEGLMQLLPETAQLLGITDLSDPDNSIHAGIKYLAYLRNRFEEALIPEDRIWFTLAAYNAGYNRVKRARRLADEMGLDGDRWFDNVEAAMLALSRPYKRDGAVIRYCRCGQTAHYIREIRTLYNNYVRITRSLRIASTGRLSSRGG